MKNHHVYSVISLIINFVCCQYGFTQSLQWDVLPMPDAVIDVGEPVKSLNGTWKLNLKPPEKFWESSLSDEKWDNIVVPGEPAMQGFEVEHDKEFAYRKEFTVPEEFKDKRIFIRFESIYSSARVWINGRYLRDHASGFTSWDCEITDYVNPGLKALLAVGVVDRMDDISFASGYAKHPIGGILRDVYLYCLPQKYIHGLNVQTLLDPNYQDAILKVSAQLSCEVSAQVQLSLKDPSGKTIPLTPAQIKFEKDPKKASVEIPIEQVIKWDAEHPNLYTLSAELIQEGCSIEKIVRKIGFRAVEIRTNKILVNGKQVHLRGANRHDIHPTLGRTSGKELDLQDVLLAKEANINFIRTSHYPPSKAFLEYCDQYGIYIEEETAVCFINQAQDPYGAAINGTQDKSEYTDRYLSRLYEMIDRDQNHASVIIWSIGNENRYGINFQKSYDLVKELDNTRPVIFSYPRTAGQNICYEIESMHYPSWTGNKKDETHWEMNSFERLERPVIGDEWAHVACYNNDFDINRDPAIRNYWGQSIKAMWENAFVSNGTAGGAIWGMIDETFQLPDKCVGYGEWGIYDIWRRRKPEFWLTQKGYSPVRIDESSPLSIGDNGIEIPVKNWFDHTNFSELLIQWRIGNRSGNIYTSLAPGKEGVLIIPVKDVKQDEQVYLGIYDQFTRQPQLIDQFQLSVKFLAVQVCGLQGPAPQLTQDSKEIAVTGKDFQFIFDKQKGCIKKGTYKGQEIIVGGPSLNLTPMILPSFSLDTIEAAVEDDAVRVHIAGKYDTLMVNYQISMDGHGTMQVQYSIDNLPKDSELYEEVGLAFDIVDRMDTLQWRRRGLYSVYPQDHIGRNIGTAAKTSLGENGAYRTRPAWSWSEDMHDFFYIGSNHKGYGMTADFRSTKEYIYYTSVADSKTHCGLKVESDGQSHAVRVEFMHFNSGIADQFLRMYINRDWTFNLGWGNKSRQAARQGIVDTFLMKWVSSE